MSGPCPGKAPCGSCPYRRDVPAGIWHPEEYAKLPRYDGETWEQSPSLFFCHQQDGNLCAGWVGCHDADHLLAFRMNRVDPSVFTYASPVPLFASGREAAEHGLLGVSAPDRRARQAIGKLQRKLSQRPSTPETPA
ncbi:DUF6283 family protein [Sphingopyxis sp. NJF-3]